MTSKASISPLPSSLRWTAALVWLVAVVLCVLGARHNFGRFASGYLFAWLFWLGASLGSLALIMLNHMTGGNWGLPIRRAGESASLVLPLMLILFLPILFGLPYLYPWARPHEVEADAVLRHRQAWMNVTFFVARYLIYFFIWSGLATFMAKWSLQLDQTKDPHLANRIRKLSAAGLLMYAVTISLAAVDWIMSRQPHWYSTIFGFTIIIGQALTGLCVMLVTLWFIRRKEPIARRLTPDIYIDLGNLVMTLVILWSYMTLSQFVVSWMGNSQEEAGWYVQRTSNGWRCLAIVLMILHFFIPFVLLLMRDIKKRAGPLTLIAFFLLFMRAADLYWVTTPSVGFSGAGPDDAHWLLSFSWMDLTSFIAIGGLWLGLFLRFLSSRPLNAEPDPEVEMLPEHG